MKPSTGVCLFLVSLLVPFSLGQTFLRADGNSAGTYNLLNSVLGATAYESADNSDDVAHITQVVDSTLGQPVFAFALHVGEDDDRSTGDWSRQRTEIKVHKFSKEDLKCRLGQNMSYSWDVKLDAKFQPSTAFTHIFQIKAVALEGAFESENQPFLTITPKITGTGTVLQVIHAGADSTDVIEYQGDIANYLGVWLHVTVGYTCSPGGGFIIRIERKDTRAELLSLAKLGKDMWRVGNDYLRPKWGIYRSLAEDSQLRDEVVYFNNFCLAKGGTTKCV